MRSDRISGLALLSSQIPFLFFLEKSSPPWLLFQVGRRSSFSSLSFRSFVLGDIPRKRQQGAHSSWRGRCFFCCLLLRVQAAILVLFVFPPSFLTSPWSRRMFWVFNICVDLAPQRERHGLGFIVSHSHLWPTANGAHAYVFAYPCFGRCSPYCNQISRSEVGQAIQLSASLFGCRLLYSAVGFSIRLSASLFGCRLLYSAVGFSIRLKLVCAF